MAILLALFGTIISVYGIITGSIAMGTLFLISLISFLLTFASGINRGIRLTGLGIIMLIISLLITIYSGLYVFCNIDVRTILGI